MKKHFKSVLIFTAGFVCAGLLAVLLLVPQSAQATFNKYTCPRQSLDYNGMNFVMDSDDFGVSYKFPGCIISNGFKAEAAFIHGDTIYIRYTK